jgi:hypothetical protein
MSLLLLVVLHCLVQFTIEKSDVSIYRERAVLTSKNIQYLDTLITKNTTARKESEISRRFGN